MLNAVDRRVVPTRLVGACLFSLTLVAVMACDGSTATRETSSLGEAVDSAACETTKPGSDRPPGEEAGTWYTNGSGVWTVLSPTGMAIIGGAGGGQIEPDGTLSVKWPWWRDGTGQLQITGRRLGADPGRLAADVPGFYGPGFQPSGISFSSEGCWEVSGTVGGAQLTFVVEVIRGRGP